MKNIKNNVLHSLHKHEKLDYIISAIFSVIILLLSFQTPSDAAETKKILVLHSYHQGLVWTDDIMEGIYSVFNKYSADTEIYVEYMDTKRYFDGLKGKYLTGLRNMYKDKYGGMKFDMIISSDDNAFQFLLLYHDELFPGTPIVFCGVNNFEDAMLSGHDYVTGVIELLDIKASIDIALKLHPEAKEIAIITDTSESGNANRKIIEQLADEYKGKAEFVFIDKDNTGLTLQELLERLRLLKKGSVIFYSDFLRNRGEYIIQETAVPQISSTCKRPIYTHYDEILGLGVVGGKLIDGKSHGRKAAQMALQILQGTPVSRLPVYKESTNLYMFDYQQLTRFGIDENALPKGSVVINRPFTFYSQYKQLVWTVSGVFSFLVISLIAISVNVVKRKKAEEELKNAYDTLEHKVEERTIALSKANLALHSEITERRLAEEALKKRETQLTDSQRVAHLGRWEWDIPTNKLVWSDEVYKIYGVNPEQFSPTYDLVIDAMHQDSRNEFHQAIQQTLSGEKPFELDYRLTRPDGTERIVHTIGEVTRDEGGKPVMMFGIVQDITERNKVEAELKESHERLLTVLDSLNAIVYVADMKTYEILFINKYTRDVFGDIEGKICWQTLQTDQSGQCNFCSNDQLLTPDGKPAGVYSWEFQNTVNGSWYIIQDRAIQWVNGKLVRMEIATDITERKKMEQKLQEMTITDDLTGLLNRRGFFTLAEQQCKLSDRAGMQIYLLYIDLDGFKTINDELGHEAGDQALIDTANVLRKTFRESDIIARIGGDEFVVLLADPSEPDIENIVIRHVTKNLEIHNEQSGRNFVLMFSMGVANYNPERPCAVSELLTQADELMYEDKKRNKSPLRPLRTEKTS